MPPFHCLGPTTVRYAFYCALTRGTDRNHFTVKIAESGSNPGVLGVDQVAESAASAATSIFVKAVKFNASSNIPDGYS